MAKIVQPEFVAAFRQFKVLPDGKVVGSEKIGKYHIYGMHQNYYTYMTSCGMYVELDTEQASEMIKRSRMEDVQANEICKKCLGRLEVVDE